MSFSIELNFPSPSAEMENLNETVELLNAWVNEVCDVVKEGEKHGIPSGFQYYNAMINYSYANLPFEGCPLEVRESKYGRGVFATRDIKKGEIPTLYPVHYFLTPPDKKGRSNGAYHTEKRIDYDGRYSLTHSRTKAQHQGDKDFHSPLFMGHLINDYCPFVEEFKDKKKLGETMMKYFIYGISFQNCEFESTEHWIAIRMSKDIKAGDELLIAYSPTYWAEVDTTQVAEEVCKYIKKVSRTNPQKALFLAKKFAEYSGLEDKYNELMK